MATAAELAASLKNDGYNVSQSEGAELPVMVGATPPTAIEQIVQPAIDMVKDPSGVAQAALQGVNKAFGDFIPDLTEKIQGTMSFPIIRGAELAAKAFSNEDHEPEFTSLKQMIGDRMAYTQSLRERVPGWVDGTQAGITVLSTRDLIKTGYKNIKTSIIPEIKNEIIPKVTKYIPENIKGVSANVWEKTAKTFRGKSSTKLADQLIPDVDGPPLDAIINHPDKVLELVKSNKVSLDDVATEIGDELLSIKQGLGKAVGIEKDKFIADPLKRIITTEPVNITNPQGQQMVLPSPLQVISDFRKSKMDDGKSILDAKQSANLKDLEELLTPKVTTIQKVDPIYGTSRGSYQKMEKDISPKRAMLAIEKIDDILDYERIAKGKLESDFIKSLLDTRRTVKYQMRGNNISWFQADENNMNFMELENGMINKLRDSNSAESFVDHIFGVNKDRVREKLVTALNYRDFLDTKVTGSGDAFFRRMAVIQGARKIKKAQGQITRVQQAKTHEIVRQWIGRSSFVGAGIGAGAGSLAGFTGATIGGSAGATAGSYIGLKIGQKMADPVRILNAAIREKNISNSGRKLAQDLLYIHQNFGNDGIISMLDILGPIPALNEITKFGQSKPKYEVRAEKLGIPK